MGKKIYANVYVTSKDGTPKFFEAGDEVPDEFASLITAPVWDKPKDETEEPAEPTGGPTITDEKPKPTKK